MWRTGRYHRAEAAATRTCPLCGGACDRFGGCARAHPAVRVIGTTYVYRDFRDNLGVDADAPVLAWRQQKGHRLGYENSQEAVAWNVFRVLELTGALPTVLRERFALHGAAELYYWARDREGRPLPAFADARAALEEHLKGPDINSGDPDVAILAPDAKVVLFVEAYLSAPIASHLPPRWFAAARTPAERRRRRAILDGMTREEESLPFRRTLDEVIRRGFYPLARRFLLARATARRLGDGWAARLASVVNLATVRRADADVTRFRELLAPPAVPAYLACTWADLWRATPEPLRARRIGAFSLEEYLRKKTVNRAPARLLPE